MLKFQELKKYLGIFILAVAVIIVYKTFDNFGYIIDFFAKIISLLTPFFIGAAIAFVLLPLCKKIERLLKKTNVGFLRKYRRGFSVLAVFIIVIAAIVLIMVAIIPQLIDSITRFIEQAPTMFYSLSEWLKSLRFFPKNITVSDILNNNMFPIGNILDSFELRNMNKYARGVMNFGTTMFNFLLGIIISVYILLDRRQIKRGYMRFARLFFPDKFRKGLHFYSKSVADFINRYIGCQLLDACIVFLLCLIALTIMKNEYAAVIALMVGSFNLIPYFGAFIAVLISALITLVTNGFMSAVILIAVLIVLQQIDANIIQPRLVASQLSIKPLWVIFGVILGGGLFGIIGMFIGVPIVALLKIIISDIIEQKNMNKLSQKNNNEYLRVFGKNNNE